MLRPEQLEEMLRLGRQALNQGAVGIGFGVQYLPGASREEVLRLFELCAEFRVPCHSHVRYLGPQPQDNNSLAGIEELIAAAAVCAGGFPDIRASSRGAFEPSESTISRSP